MRLLLRCVVVMVVVAVGVLDTTSAVLTDPKFAVPLRKPSRTVDALLHFEIDKGAGTCRLVLIDGLPVNRTYTKQDKKFQIPELGPCLFFRCKKKGIKLSLKKSGCQYGDQCVNKVPNEEGRTYFCLIQLEQVEKTVEKENGAPGLPHIQYRVLNGFVATPPVFFTASFDRKTKTCTLGNQTILRGDPVDVSLIPGMDPCAVVICGKKGLQYQPEESACTVDGVGCRTSYERGCTLFTCVRSVLFHKARRGKSSSQIINSWMRRGPPTCRIGERCVRLQEVVGPTEDPPCSELACLEGEPGLPEILPTQTGCLVELLGDQCVGLDQLAGNLVPVGPPAMLDEDTCVDYFCNQLTSDPFRPTKAALEPGEFGCRDTDLADTLPDNGEPFGCFRQGVITERNCTRLKCMYVDGVALIMAKDLMGRCIDDQGICRFPGDVWTSAAGERCECNLGGGTPTCTPAV